MKSSMHYTVVAKADLIRQILDNPVYMPESGLIDRLAKVLLKLSFSDLSNLLTVIKCKD